MPALSASDYTKFLKFKAAAATPIRPAIQTRDNATLSQSVLNANILTTAAAQVVTPGISTVYAPTTRTFSYTGGNQVFTVPSLVYGLSVALTGAGGQTASTGTNQGEGGYGGFVSGNLQVSPGETLTFVVGGASGFGGGGAAGGDGGGSGGGRSAILRNGSDIVTAGGGGGGGLKTQGGAGGALTGASGAAIGGISTPGQSVVDSTGNLFVANTGGNTIVKITPAGIASVFAGSGSTGSGNGTGTAATFTGPKGLAIDSSDNLYVADTGSRKIRKITPGAVVTTIAGSGTAGSADNTTGTSATFNAPNGLAIVGTTLYVADQTTNKVRAIALSGNFPVTSPYGSGTAGTTDANGTSATFNNPYGLVTDGTDLYVSDYAAHKIRKITISTTAVTTLAGSTSGNTNNTTGTSAQFNAPAGLAFASGLLYVADSGNNSIRTVSLTSPYAVTTYSGSSAGWTGLTVSTALYTTPVNITYSNGVLYVSDGNNLIRKIVIATSAVTDMIVDATGGTQTAIGTSGSGAGDGSGTTGGAGKSGDQAGGGGGGYFGGGGGTTGAAGAGGSSFVSNLSGTVVNTQGGGALPNTDGVIVITYTAPFKDGVSPSPGRVNHPNALSTVGFAGTSGAMSSSAFQRPGGLPTGFKGSQNSYTRLPQNAGWIQGNTLSSGPKRF